MIRRFFPYIIIVISIVFVFISQVMFKQISGSIQFDGFSLESVILLVHTLFKNVYYWLALFAFGFSMVLWLIGLKNLSLSQAFSLTSLNYIFIALYSFFILNEDFTFMKILSCVFIICGIILINFKKVSRD